MLVFAISQIPLYSTKAVQKCGPNALCECENVSDVNSGFLMNCEAIHDAETQVGLDDVCNSINATYTNVTHLHTGRNNFGNLHSNMTAGCWNLTMLDLHYNQMTLLIPDAFRSFQHLKTLDLSDNDLPVCVEPHINLLTAPYFPVLGSKIPCIVYITSTTFSEMCLK